MRKTLEQLIHEESNTVTNLNIYAMDVEYYANEILRYQEEMNNFLTETKNYRHSEKFINDEKSRLSIFIDVATENRDRAIEKRDTTIQELTNVRAELKQYLLDIISEY